MRSALNAMPNPASAHMRSPKRIWLAEQTICLQAGNPVWRYTRNAALLVCNASASKPHHGQEVQAITAVEDDTLHCNCLCQVLCGLRLASACNSQHTHVVDNRFNLNP